MDPQPLFKEEILYSGMERGYGQREAPCRRDPRLLRDSWLAPRARQHGPAPARGSARQASGRLGRKVPSSALILRCERSSLRLLPLFFGGDLYSKEWRW